MRTGRPRTVSDEAIFEAVKAVVTEVGPPGLTLAAVADRVGLSAPALTQRFGSKRSLLLAYAEAAATGVDDRFTRARCNSPTALSALRAALLELTAGIDSRDALANHLAFLHLDLTDPELGAYAAKQSRLLRRAITRLLEEAITTGEIESHRSHRAGRHHLHHLQRRPRHLGDRRHRKSRPMALRAARPRPCAPPTGVTLDRAVDADHPHGTPHAGTGHWSRRCEPPKAQRAAGAERRGPRPPRTV